MYKMTIIMFQGRLFSCTLEEKKGNGSLSCLVAQMWKASRVASWTDDSTTSLNVCKSTPIHTLLCGMYPAPGNKIQRQPTSRHSRPPVQDGCSITLKSGAAVAVKLHPKTNANVQGQRKGKIINVTNMESVRKRLEYWFHYHYILFPLAFNIAAK